MYGWLLRSMYSLNIHCCDCQNLSLFRELRHAIFIFRLDFSLKSYIEEGTAYFNPFRVFLENIKYYKFHSFYGFYNNRRL